MKKFNKSLSAVLFLVGGIFSADAAANRASSSSSAAATRAEIEQTFGFMPQYLASFPDVVLPGTWQELKSMLFNPNTALSGKSKELIGLGVSAQIPCSYCIEAHTKLAKLNGATQAEVGEAVATAALSTHWSAYINGIGTDEAKYRQEVGKIVDNTRKKSVSGASKSKAVVVIDGKSALDDISNTFGFTPEYLKRFPDVARAGAWQAMKDVQLNSDAAISKKDKNLIGLAVASQLPSKLAIISFTEFAKLEGASDAEITEALAVAAITRHMSTLLNGMRVDPVQFSRDIDRIIQGVKASASAK